MKIVDNFLDQKKFDELQDLMMGRNFMWFHNDVVDARFKNDGEITGNPSDYVNPLNFFLFHYLYFQDSPLSQHFNNLFPILDIINPMTLYLVKANLIARTPNINVDGFHFDMNGASEEKLKHWTTSIFYVNTNNGYTEFEDGTKVESVANRFVSFPANSKHRGTSCSDENKRVIINFNYFK